MPQDRAPNFDSRWERRAFLERATDRAEFEVPEGRISGVIRQLRHRADAARRRSNAIFGMLLVGIVFYLGQPFLRLYVDGQRVALQRTLDSTAATARDLRAEAGAYDAETLTQVADALAADKVEFGKGNTPSDQAVEIARSILARK